MSLKLHLQKDFVLLKTTGFTDINFMEFVQQMEFFIPLKLQKQPFMISIFLKNIKQQISDCVQFGNRIYLSQSIPLDLFRTVNIKLKTPKIKNQKDYKPHSFIFRKSTKIIEILFSQLFDQLEIIMLKLLKVLKQEFQ